MRKRSLVMMESVVVVIVSEKEVGDDGKCDGGDKKGKVVVEDGKCGCSDRKGERGVW